METYRIDDLEIKVERTFNEEGKSIAEALVDIFIEYTKANDIKIISD
ncbi:MAG: hypothetical protein K2M08_02015 [Anaeroplasmataceae bacterium]|nr:hypothetical protein [Anaeroplasmataceae bacterium]MDE6241177.1 hypothetical protein [Anaeroplasmataceae bacterium]